MLITKEFLESQAKIGDPNHRSLYLKDTPLEMWPTNLDELVHLCDTLLNYLSESDGNYRDVYIGNRGRLTGRAGNAEIYDNLRFILDSSTVLQDKTQGIPLDLNTVYAKWNDTPVHTLEEVQIIAKLTNTTTNLSKERLNLLVDVKSNQQVILNLIDKARSYVKENPHVHIN